MPLLKGNMPDIVHLFCSIKLNKSIRYIMAFLLQINIYIGICRINRLCPEVMN